MILLTINQQHEKGLILSFQELYLKVKVKEQTDISKISLFSHMVFVIHKNSQLLSG